MRNQIVAIAPRAIALLAICLVVTSPVINSDTAKPPSREAAQSPGDRYTIQACRTFSSVQPRTQLGEPHIQAAMEARAMLGSDPAVTQAIGALRRTDPESPDWDDAVWRAGYACMVWGSM